MLGTFHRCDREWLAKGKEILNIRDEIECSRHPNYRLQRRSALLQALHRPDREPGAICELPLAHQLRQSLRSQTSSELLANLINICECKIHNNVSYSRNVALRHRILVFTEPPSTFNHSGSSLI
jgi:hypothetical protein